METRDSTAPVPQNERTTKKPKHRAPRVARARVRKDWDLQDSIKRSGEAFRDTFKKLAR